METLMNGFEFLQQALYEACVQPLAVWVGASNLLEQAYEGTGWLLVGLLQIAIMLVVMTPMEKIWPVEHWRDRQAV